MKKLLLAFGLLFLLVAPALTQSLNDELVLGSDQTFQGRVRSSIITAAINISADGLTTGINIKRHAQVQQIMNQPDYWKVLFAEAIATQATVIGPATSSGTVALTPCTNTTGSCNGNVATQGALVSDSVINTAVAAVFNSFFGGQ